MDYDLDDISPLLDEPVELSQWMGNERFSEVDDVPCPGCNTILQLQSFSWRGDGVILRCPNNACRHFVSPRQCSYFRRSRLSLAKQMQLLILFL